MSKIFIGLLDIASQISDWKKGFRALGVDTLTASIRRQHIVQKNEVDIDISTLPRLSYRGVRPRKFQSYLQDKWDFGKNSVFRRALRECDIFIIIGRSFFGDHSDFRMIKDAGKKLVCIFTGDDSRWYYCMKQEFERYGMPPLVYPPDYDLSLDNLEKHLSHLRSAEKYADLIISIPNQAQMALRPYDLYFSCLDMEQFPFSPVQRTIPKIIHAPSSPHFKGTQYFLDAVERLQREGVQFEFELVQNLPNEEAIRRYRDADIILNQVFCPCGGKLAHEGMALGKVVLTRMAYEEGYDEKTPPGCPLVDVGPGTVYEKLKEIIADRPLREELGRQGRQFTETHNDARIVAGRILELLNNKQRQHDFYPDFFRDYFVPESAAAAVLYNKWNRFVGNCDWYEGYVGHFERSGLVF